MLDKSVMALRMIRYQETLISSLQFSFVRKLTVRKLWSVMCKLCFCLQINWWCLISHMVCLRMVNIFFLAISLIYLLSKVV